MKNIYNTNKHSLILREYGRNIQQLIELIMSIKDKEKRTKLSYGIIKIMKSVNPRVRSISEDSRKLWDDLFIMSNYKLDIDAPYPMPQKDIMKRKVPKIPYKQNLMKFKHYGRNVELLIQKISLEKDKSLQKKLLLIILRVMKGFNVTWNTSNNDLDGIIKDLQSLLPSPLDMDFEEIKKEYFVLHNAQKSVNKSSYERSNNYKNPKWTNS